MRTAVIITSLMSLLMVAPAPAVAQSTSATALTPEPATPADMRPRVTALARDLATADAARREQLLAGAHTLPEAAQPALEAAIAEESTSGFARADLQVLLQDLRTRWRAARLASLNRWEDDYHAQMIDYYKTAGKHDPRWDDLAVTALAAPNTDPLAFDKCQKALFAQCTDPLVMFTYHDVALRTERFPAPAAAEEMFKAARAIEDSSAPPLLKFRMLLRALSAATPDLPQSVNLADYQAAERRMLAMLPRLHVADFPLPALYRLSESLLAIATTAHDRQRQTAYNEISPLLEKALGKAHPAVLYATALFYKDFAWDGRGNGGANTVTPEGWKLFAERLATAEDCATRGWKADPLDPHCAALMITVCMGRQHDRAVMEQWFDRAMAADPACYDACSRKLVYLYPQWYGSEEEMLAFARECLERGPTGSRVPLILEKVHSNLARLSDDRIAYMQQPAVWRELDAACRKSLAPADQPMDVSHYRRTRSLYFRYACDCEQWPLVLDLAKAYGNDLDIDIVGTEPLQKYFRKKAAREVVKSH